MPDELRLIVNPHRDADADAVAGLADVVERPDAPEGIGAAAERSADADVVGAVGGDGTQRAVAAAIAGGDASLLVVPAGTVNLLGHLYGIESVDDVRRALADGEDRRLDLGRCNGAPFLLNASTGYDADVMAGVGDRAKRFGRLGYVAVGAARLAWARCRPCRVRVDGRDVFDGAALTVLVLNVAYRGFTRVVLAPGAAPDDGRLHVLVATGRSAVLRAVWALVRGGRPRADDVVAADGVRIDVEWDVDVNEQLDGDAVGTGRRFAYELEPGAVTLRVPRSR